MQTQPTAKTRVIAFNLNNPEHTWKASVKSVVLKLFLVMMACWTHCQTKLPQITVLTGEVHFGSPPFKLQMPTLICGAKNTGVTRLPRERMFLPLYPCSLPSYFLCPHSLHLFNSLYPLPFLLFWLLSVSFPFYLIPVSFLRFWPAAGEEKPHAPALTYFNHSTLNTHVAVQGMSGPRLR